MQTRSLDSQGWPIVETAAVWAEKNSRRRRRGVVEKIEDDGDRWIIHVRIGQRPHPTLYLPHELTVYRRRPKRG